MDRKELHKKATLVTGLLLKEKGYISFVDVFMMLGYLDPKDYEDWRRKRVPYLEKVIKVNLGQINFVMEAIRQNSLNGKLKPSWTSYESWGKGPKIDLRFSKTGEENIESLYATHFVKTEKGGAYQKTGRGQRYAGPTA
jgi:hypothetical protein